ncbi:MAG: ion transporter [Oceanospirillaceae bacterium]|nr:ion transporter [Oceanospirillaceae bacterium]MBT12326.1 ion transporter [Oceanospirillaceae bacterium]|tara:strand:+ start:28820 stop:29662 length:843 start_codon:yes stop_codon:yes gene_type:complete
MIVSLSSAIGLSGVDVSENTQARRVGRYFEWPMIGIAFWIIFEWYLEAQADKPLPFAHITDWFLWTFFLLETVILTSLVDDKKRYLRTNWSNLVIVIAGMPLLWEYLPYAGGLRALRLLAMFTMLMNMSGSFQKIMGRNHLGPTLMVSFIIIVMAGTLMALIDPNVDTPLDGIWWAWVTVTTVGYGDIVPGTTAGRLFGSLLILMGIGLFSMMTASFSAFFMQREEEDLFDKERSHAAQLEKMEGRMEQLEKKLDRLLIMALEAERAQLEKGRDPEAGER